MSERQKNSSEVRVPSWMTRHPFPPGEKRPTVLTRETSIPRVYGRPPHEIPTYVHVSTDKVTCTEFQLASGAWFEPADTHAGDEVYYVLEGQVAAANPETGEVVHAEQGDFVLIPKGTWHQAYNFSLPRAIILCSFAPRVWSEEEPMPQEFPGEPVVYKGMPPTAEGLKRVDPAVRPEAEAWQAEHSARSPLELLGQWPGAGPELREKRQMVLVRRAEGLKLIHGRQNRVLACFYVSNDFLHVGTLQLPPRAASDPEEHQGDEVMYTLEGSASVRLKGHYPGVLPDQRFEVKKGERMLVPEGISHQYLNFSDQVAVILFTIAPGL